MDGQGSGWHGEPQRHSLARMGVKTVIPDNKPFDMNNFIAGGKWKLPFSEENLQNIFLEVGETSDKGWYLIQDFIAIQLPELELIPEEIIWESSLDYIYYMDRNQQVDFYDVLNEFWIDQYGEHWNN